MIGNIAMVILYPILAIFAALIQMSTTYDLPPHAMIGASGAIMGLAGMYFILSPIYRVHMVAWWRWSLIRRFHLSYKIFSKPGYWVLLFYISFDVMATLLHHRGGTAHWAHLGGFLTGMAFGLLLLITRLVNARGGDLLSGLLGRRAWWLVGKPDATRPSLIAIV